MVPIIRELMGAINTQKLYCNYSCRNTIDKSSIVFVMHEVKGNCEIEGIFVSGLVQPAAAFSINSESLSPDFP